MEPGRKAELVLDSDGNLYGATRGGGTYLDGTVYELSPGANGQWTETILYSFAGGAGDGAWPTGVIRDEHGNLYGLTTIGGTNNLGTAFELIPEGSGE